MKAARIPGPPSGGVTSKNPALGGESFQVIPMTLEPIALHCTNAFRESKDARRLADKGAASRNR